jgi:hypothetical protein
MPYSAEKGLDIAFHSDRMITPASKKLFSWSVHPLKYACRGSTPDPLVRMGLESDPDRRRASALNATRQDSVQHPDSIDLS